MKLAAITISILLSFVRLAEGRTCNEYLDFLFACAKEDLGLAGADECLDCIRWQDPDGVTEGSDCETYNQGLCASTNRCNCGSCAEEVEVYVSSCVLDFLTGNFCTNNDCTYAGDSSGGTTTPPPPLAAGPLPSSSVGQVQSFWASMILGSVICVSFL